MSKAVKSFIETAVQRAIAAAAQQGSTGAGGADHGPSRPSQAGSGVESLSLPVPSAPPSVSTMDVLPDKREVPKMVLDKKTSKPAVKGKHADRQSFVVPEPLIPEVTGSSRERVPKLETLKLSPYSEGGSSSLIHSMFVPLRSPPSFACTSSSRLRAPESIDIDAAAPGSPLAESRSFSPSLSPNGPLSRSSPTAPSTNFAYVTPEAPFQASSDGVLNGPLGPSRASAQSGQPSDVPQEAEADQDQGPACPNGLPTTKVVDTDRELAWSAPPPAWSS